MKYYLIDTSAIIPYYVPSYLTKKITRIIEEKQKGEAFLYMPNFCIAEVFNTFAKFCFRQKKITEKEYEACSNKFKDAIHNARLIYHYELNRYHILNIDCIAPFEHQYCLTRIKKTPNGKEENEDWFMSTFDMLLISMGIELVKMMGNENVSLITCDKRIKTICDVLRLLDPKIKAKFGIPSYTIYPEAKLLASF